MRARGSRTEDRAPTRITEPMDTRRQIDAMLGMYSRKKAILWAAGASLLVAALYLIAAFFIITGAWRRAAGDDPAISPSLERMMLALVEFPFAYLVDSILVVPLLNAVLWGSLAGLLTAYLVKSHAARSS